MRTLEMMKFAQESDIVMRKSYLCKYNSIGNLIYNIYLIFIQVNFFYNKHAYRTSTWRKTGF